MAPTPRRWSRSVTVLVAIVAAVAVVAGIPATAGPPGATPSAAVQEEMDQHLAAYPGGEQISPTQVSYAGGTFIIAFAPPVGVAGVPDCGQGWFCMYDGVNYTYPRAQLSSCGWQDLANWGWQDRTESVHFYASSGSVAFINHLYAGHGGDPQLFSISSYVATDNDVSPYRNQADHVNHYC